MNQPLAFVSQLIDDLRTRRLWPIAAALLVALVAVPVLLSNSGSSPAVGSQAQPPAPAATALPAVSVQGAAAHVRLSGHGRDPFAQQSLPRAVTTTATSLSSGATGTAASSSSTTTSIGSQSSTQSSTQSVSSATGAGTPATGTTRAAKPTPAAPGPGLRGTETYDVVFAITDGAGNFHTVSSLRRMSVIPSLASPALVELGVLQGGRRVLFAVQRGTLLRGPGSCVPGRLDCEILSLAPGQVEAIARRGANNSVSVHELSVARIAIVHHASVAAADAVRRSASAAGRKVLAASGSSALSLFRYDVARGVIIDLRNLHVAAG
jgi:hypothetical protein